MAINIAHIGLSCPVFVTAHSSCNGLGLFVKNARLHGCRQITSCLSHTNGRSGTELPQGLDLNRLPQHVAVIMDGNSRWAKAMGLAQSAGHTAGIKALVKLIRLSCALGMTAFTAFLFSTENWNRSQVEVAFLMQLWEKLFVDNLETFMRYDAQVRVIGDVSGLPISLQEAIGEAERKTRGNKGLKLSCAVNYGGRLDMIRACQQIAKKVKREELEIKDISEKTIDEELWTSWLQEDARNPDLIIRTSGEQRISNFVLWQAAYSEIMFVDTYWPAFDEALYLKALLAYQNRHRRYGRREAPQVETNLLSGP